MLHVKVGFISYFAASIRVRPTAEMIYLAWKVIVKLASILVSGNYRPVGLRDLVVTGMLNTCSMFAFLM